MANVQQKQRHKLGVPMRVYIKDNVTREWLIRCGIKDHEALRWLTESKESFHGVLDKLLSGKLVFTFQDSRIPGTPWVTLDMVIPETTIKEF